MKEQMDGQTDKKHDLEGPGWSDWSVCDQQDGLCGNVH